MIQINRRPIFQAVKRLRNDAAFTAETVAILDAGIDEALASLDPNVAPPVPAPATAPVAAAHQPSQRVIDFIKGFEQCRLTAYLPTPQDRPTIGWGTTGPDVRLGMTWTQLQADVRFARDLADFAAGVNHLLGTCPTTQGQFDALLSFAYNVGLDDDADTKAEGLGDSTLLRKHLAGDHTGAAAEFPKWNKQAGRVLAGLTRRRAAEAAMYLS